MEFFVKKLKIYFDYACDFQLQIRYIEKAYKFASIDDDDMQKKEKKRTKRKEQCTIDKHLHKHTYTSRK